MKILSEKWMKILKTGNLYLSFFLAGLCLSVLGPCLLDLQHLVHTDTQHIALVFTARSVGFLFGSILGGILLDAIKSKQAVMTVCNLFLALTMIGPPWCRGLGTLIAYMAVGGLATGTILTGGNAVCLKLWGGGGGPFLQALHFAFGVGGLLAPLIAEPFLIDYYSDGHAPVEEGDNATCNNGNFTNFAIGLKNLNSSAVENTLPSIVYPFSIIGGLGVMVTLMFLAVSIMSPFEEEAALDKTSKDAKKSSVFLVSVVFLGSVLQFAQTGLDVGYPQMLTTYAVKGRLQLSTSTGSFMTSTFWAAFTVSRLASIFLAIKVSNFIFIVSDLVICLIGSLISVFFASCGWSLWTASALLGLGISSFTPSTIGWMDAHINVNNRIVSVFIAGAGFGDMVIPYSVGYFMDSVPDAFLYTVLASSLLSSLVVFILYLVLRSNKIKNTNQDTDCSPVGDLNSCV